MTQFGGVGDRSGNGIADDVAAVRCPDHGGSTMAEPDPARRAELYFYSYNDTLTTGKLSVLYKPTPNSSVYATVANSKQPPGGANFTLSASASRCESG